jgi:hypothetical protein
MKGSASLIALAGLLWLTSCSKSSVNPTVTARFAATSSSFSESQGTANAVITLSGKAAQDVVITYTWVGADSATYLGGDFNFTSPSTVTIKAGETQANLGVTIIDDAQIDTDDVIRLTLVSATGANLSTTSADLLHAMTITNNDITPIDQLQIDLTWKTSTTGKVPLDVNGVNLDLLTRVGVVVSSNQITNPGTDYVKSANTSGFESVRLSTSDPDKVYYIVVPYVTGTSKVYYSVALNGWGYANNPNGSNVGTDVFAATEIGAASFLGPFTKLNNTFTFGRKTDPLVIPIRVKDFIHN